MLSHTPLMASLSLTNHSVVVIGAGPIARRKMLKLFDAGAQVRLIAPKPAETEQWIAALPKTSNIQWLQRTFVPDDLADCVLVLACTNDPDTNRQIAAHARERNVLCNVADPAQAGDVAFTATSHTGTLRVAISTNRTSPALAKLAREGLDATFGPEWADAGDIAQNLRAALKRSVTNPKERAAILKRWVRSPVLDLLRSGRYQDALMLTQELCGVSHTQLTKTVPTHEGPLIISAFGPFPGVEVNPTIAVAHQLSSQLNQIGIDTHVVELPTHYDTAWTTLANALKPLKHTTRGVLALGVASRAQKIRLERIGVNHRDGGRPDSSGRTIAMGGEALCPGGPHGLMSRLAVEHLARELSQQGWPVTVSNSAGTYICNEVFYNLMRWCNRSNFRGFAGFVHIPPVPEQLAQEVVVETLVALVKMQEG